MAEVMDSEVFYLKHINKLRRSFSDPGSLNNDTHEILGELEDSKKTHKSKKTPRYAVVNMHVPQKTPIDDLRGTSRNVYSNDETERRCKLAACYRLVDLMGWSEGIFNHISLRVSQDKDEFLINPFGLLYNEVTASSLLSVDLEGNIKDAGTTCLGINKAGYVLHSTIHEARPDINCIIHVHTPDAAAISSMKCGFLRISQESLIVGNVSYHDYFGILIDDAEKESIKNDLGPDNMIMFLRNHGVVVCGRDIETAFHMLCTLMEACRIQVRAVSVGVENLNLISDEVFQQVQNSATASAVKMGSSDQVSLSEYYFEAYMRWLDDQGHCTGYSYLLPDL